MNSLKEDAKRSAGWSDVEIAFDKKPARLMSDDELIENAYPVRDIRIWIEMDRRNMDLSSYIVDMRSFFKGMDIDKFYKAEDKEQIHQILNKYKHIVDLGLKVGS